MAKCSDCGIPTDSSDGLCWGCYVIRGMQASVRYLEWLRDNRPEEYEKGPLKLVNPDTLRQDRVQCPRTGDKGQSAILPPASKGNSAKFSTDEL
ncbi:MAG: hypothetical protein HY326_00925 [Chloroflexi bacterium]|nr:hypothetical protein [Chloroflexota bacterium]